MAVDAHEIGSVSKAIDRLSCSSDLTQYYTHAHHNDISTPSREMVFLREGGTDELSILLEKGRRDQASATAGVRRNIRARAEGRQLTCLMCSIMHFICVALQRAPARRF